MSIYGTIADLRETPYGSISHFLLLIEQAEPLGWDGGPQSEDCGDKACGDICQHAQQDTGFPDSSMGKEFSCDAGDTGDVGLISGSGRSPGEGNGNPLQYSCLENSMDK